MKPGPQQIAGWQTLDRLGMSSEAQLASLKRQRDDHLALFAVVFGTDAGRQVLAILMDMTTGRSPLPETVAGQVPIGFDQIAPYVTFRMGQNSIVELIAKILAEAEKPPTSTRGTPA